MSSMVEARLVSRTDEYVGLGRRLLELWIEGWRSKNRRGGRHGHEVIDGRWPIPIPISIFIIYGYSFCRWRLYVYLVCICM